MSNVGRPRTTVDKLPANWKNLLTEVAERGGSVLEMQVKLGLGSSGWYTLIEDSEEFRNSVEMAKQQAQIWWEEKGRTLTETGSAVAWKFNMQNRFGWSDRTQTAHTGPDGGPVQVQEVRRSVVDPKH
jgi:hypothetical protein